MEKTGLRILKDTFRGRGKTFVKKCDNDPYEVWNGECFQFTLRKMFQIAELPLPMQFEDKLDLPIVDISNVNNWKRFDGLRVMVAWSAGRTKKEIFQQMIRDGVIVISRLPIFDEDGNRMPSIILRDLATVKHLWISLAKYMHDAIGLPTICVTGSIGKTTTSTMLKLIFGEQYKVYSTSGNLNIMEYITREMARYFNPSYTMHIQETAGATPEQVEESAIALRPDAFVVTTVLPHHLNRYKTIDAVLYDKTSLDRHAADDAFGVINIDNDLLRNHPFRHRIVTCGVEHQEADYVAKNVRQDGAWLRLDVVEKHKDIVPISMRIPGTHNAYNILFAYALAREWGISVDVIRTGLSKYQSDWIRQSILEIAGRVFYLDCFNHQTDSIKAALSMTSNMVRSEGGRKIAVLGGENALGANAYSVNYELGLSLRQYDIDEYIIIGMPDGLPDDRVDFVGNSRAVYDGAKRVLRDRKVTYCDSREKLVDMLQSNTKPGDFIMLKGIVHLPLWSVVDAAFGSAITIRSKVTSSFNKTKRVAENGTTGLMYESIEDVRNIAMPVGVNIHRLPVRNNSVCVPNTVQGEPVFRIGLRVMHDRTDLHSIDFGRSLVNIGCSSFIGCTGLKSLHIPYNVQFIEEEAFSGCTCLQHVVMEGITHIDSKAFRNCTTLTSVELTDSCAFIADDAFEGCPNLVLIAPEGSYAESWAKKHQVSSTVCN